MDEMIKQFFNNRPELSFLKEHVLEYSCNLLKMCALMNILSIACIFTYKASWISKLNVFSLVITTLTVFNPLLDEGMEIEDQLM